MRLKEEYFVVFAVIAAVVYFFFNADTLLAMLR